jgi:hypothetical protein
MHGAVAAIGGNPVSSGIAEGCFQPEKRKPDAKVKFRALAERMPK